MFVTVFVADLNTFSFSTTTEAREHISAAYPVIVVASVAGIVAGFAHFLSKKCT